MDKATDLHWMRRALHLAVLAREAAPNPMAGCVLVDPSGKKIGEGHTQKYGHAHAEVMALTEAGDLARSATAYVTLEPCSITSKTPPCADALIRAGVRRVAVAMIDPDTRVNGNGVLRLRDAGIQVDVGLLGNEAKRLNAPFVKHRSTGMPFVTVKTAMTLDGKIATVSGDSKWITSEITRKWVHRQLRGRNQAILTGIGTVLADNPALDVRLTHEKASQRPLRVIVDTGLKTPIDAKVVQRSALDGGTLIAFSDDPDNKIRQFEQARVNTIRIGKDANGGLDLTELLHKLGNDYKIISVLVEAGPKICATLFQNGLVDRYYSCVGPKLVGGSDAQGPIGGGGLTDSMNGAVEPYELVVRKSGRDYVTRCEFR